MLKNAMKKKLTGAVVGMMFIIVFLAAASLLLDGVAAFAIGAVLTVFLILLIWSMVKYVKGIAMIKEQYGGDFEADLDRCQMQVNDKYFFFNDFLIDLTNARMIYYSDIERIQSLVSKGLPTHDTYNTKRAGALVTLKMRNGKTLMLSDFGSTAFKTSEDTLDGYHRFMEYLSQLAPHAVQ